MSDWAALFWTIVIIGSPIAFIFWLLAKYSGEPDYENDPWYQLSTRVRNALTNYGCYPSVEGVMQYSVDDLQNVPGLGRQSLIELERWLNHHNVNQEPEPQPEPEQEQPEQEPMPVLNDATLMAELAYKNLELRQRNLALETEILETRELRNKLNV